MSISSLKSGDIIEVDKKGRRFHGLVREIRGRTVRFIPFESAISWRECTSHDIVGIWHANAKTRARVAHPAAAHA